MHILNALLLLSLTVQAAIIGPVDRRGRLNQKAEQRPFSFKWDEAYRIRNTTGYVYCPGDGSPENSTGGSGFLVGTATDMYVVTAAHNFVTEDGRRREPLASCSFTSFGLRATPIPLLFDERPRTYRAGTMTNPYGEMGLDFIVVRLSRPSPNAEPYKLGTRVDLASLNSNYLFAVSAEMKDMPYQPHDPIIQNCSVRRVLPNDGSTATIAYTDCAAKEGASGSVLLARLGRDLVPVAIIRSTKVPYQGDPAPDFLPYDEATANITVVLGLDAKFLDHARALMGASF